MKKVLKNKKAMAALQAAILTGISIAVALIVGYWIWTVVVGSIRTERLQLSIPYAEYDNTLFGGNGGWKVTIKVMNKGPSDSTITDIRINGKSYGDWGGDVEVEEGGAAITLPRSLSSGTDATITIKLKKTPFTAGQTVEVAFVTAANQVYTSSVALP